MKNFLKLWIVRFLRFLLKFFWIFPVKKNYILFCTFEGRQYSDNPKYLFLYIREHFDNKYKYIWVLNKKSDCPDNCVCVRFLSFMYFYYVSVSHFFISNLGLEPFVPKRKSQIVLNTWHGSGAYKSQTLSKKFSSSKYNVYVRDWRSEHTDFYVSGCQKYSEVMSDSWNVIPRKFISSGCPRNDILFSNKCDEIRKKVLCSLNLPNDYGYILYAPTFRGSSFRHHEVLDTGIDMEKIQSACEKKYGKKFIVLYREHIGSFGESHSTKNIVDVSSYPDMQELLLCSDVLITDYSSCMWDFALLKRPGYLFVSDLKSYKNERDFYTPMESWPFFYAETNEKLEKIILNTSENDIIKKIELHLNELRSFENGTACENVCKEIGIL